MSANKHYVPAFIGGKITGVSLTIQNNNTVDVEFTPYHGLFYVYQGKEYPLLVGDNTTISTGITHNISREIDPRLVPSSDIKLMISTGGLTACKVDVNVLWSVE